jgi:hypothetical protein
MDIVGTRGFKGKKAKNAHSQFNALFDIEDASDDSVREEEFDQSKLDALESQ